ncbi:MAG: PTS system mannose/fructose/sorbose family transporter subunit IID [Thermodesulfobacteriota bacterium]|nr:PTS system mannose/fructose/sorbose family transporter subunit IID [Thermodesulfobacteriota bacterium]
MKSMAKDGGISKWRLFRLACRCLFLQSSWNYKHFQGLGWSVALLPEVKAIYAPRHLPQVLKRYCKYFNTNTFLAPAVAAATLCLEVDQSQGRNVVMEPHTYPDAVMAPVAAVGDALFWGGIRPFLSCLAVALGAFGFCWSPIVLIVLFNLPAAIFRVVGTWLGYQHGASVVMLIQRWRLADAAILLKRCTVVVCGGLCAVLMHQGQLGLLWSTIVSVLVIVSLFAAIVCLRKGVPIVVVLLGIIATVAMVDKLLL